MSKNGAKTKGPSLVIESEADPTIFDDEPLELGVEEEVFETEAGAAVPSERPAMDQAPEEPTGDRSTDGSNAAESTFAKKLGAIMWDYAQGHPHTVIYGLVGFVLALMVLIIGFWQTLVIALFVGVGVVIGQIVDGDGVLARLFERLFSNNEQ